MSKTQLEKEIKKRYGNQRVDLYKGHMMNGDYGWIMRPFGKNEIFLGKTINEAIEWVHDQNVEREEVADNHKRLIKAHKGGRTSRFETRLNPEIRTYLDSLPISIADWIEQKAREEMNKR